MPPTTTFQSVPLSDLLAALDDDRIVYVDRFGQVDRLASTRVVDDGDTLCLVGIDGLNFALVANVGCHLYLASIA